MSWVNCDTCSKIHYKRPRDIEKNKSGKFYCSMQCFGIGQEIVVLCQVCGSKVKSNRGRKSSRKYCSHKCSNIGRRGIHYDGRPTQSNSRKRTWLRNEILKDRDNKCERCGYKEHPRILVIHHIQERAKGGSDDLINLELLCPNCHALHHLGSNPNLV